jgi:hypothetical protein
MRFAELAASDYSLATRSPIFDALMRLQIRPKVFSSNILN